MSSLALLAAGCGAQTGANTVDDAESNQAASIVTTKAAEDTSHNPDMADFANEVDTDRNGKLTRAEWQSKGLPGSSFNMFEHGRGYVTLSDYQTHAAPPGIDINGDGKLTVSEFKTFDRQMSAKMKGGGVPLPRP